METRPPQAPCSYDLFDDPKLYEELRENAWEWSKEFTFENSYREFQKPTFPNNSLPFS